jgi:hypothetical protein
MSAGPDGRGSRSTGISVGSGVFNQNHGESARILEMDSVWNHTVCQVWVHRMNTVGRIAAAGPAPQEPPRKASLDWLVLDRDKVLLDHPEYLNQGKNTPPFKAGAAG